jgi:hypothetical protein
MRASKNGDVKHLGKPDIVNVLTESANQSRIFAPLDPGADKFTDRHLISPVSDFGSHASGFNPRLETLDAKLTSPSGFWLLSHSFRRVLDRVHDVLVAGAATEVAVEGVANLVLRRFRIAYQQLMRGENHPRRTEATLQSVALPKGLLDRMKPISISQTFDGQNIASLRLHRQHRARFHRRAVQHHRASAANAGVAADMGASQPYDIAQKINQEQPRLHFVRLLDAVDP